MRAQRGGADGAAGRPVPDAGGLLAAQIFSTRPVSWAGDSTPVANTLIPRSEEHTSELQSLMRISYAVFCLKKKKTVRQHHLHQSPSSSQPNNIHPHSPNQNNTHIDQR